MGFPAGQFLQGYLLAKLGLDDGRSGDAHISGIFTLDEKVLHYRVISLSSKAGSHQQGDLWNDTGGAYLGFEKHPVGFKGIHTFVETCPTRVVHADYRPPHLLGEFYSPDLFQAMVLTERSG